MPQGRQAIVAVLAMNRFLCLAAPSILRSDRDRASGAGPVLQGGGSRVMTGGVQGSVTGVLARLYEA
ncbi:MAG TPA: hypothetical protein VK053_15010 [Jiangellaceae bacterium]|nr:hypothetical protein [Jiangellaceae bacterium]